MTYSRPARSATLSAPVQGIFGQDQHYLINLGAGLEPVEGMGHQRDTQYGGKGLVHASHTGAAPGRHDNRANLSQCFSPFAPVRFMPFSSLSLGEKVGVRAGNVPLR